jgi:hypothetical protein
MVDDGTPPSFPAVIERLCNGNPHAEGYTDTQGYFSILLGQATGVIGDASDTSGISNRTTPLSGITGGSGTGLSTGTTRAATNRFASCVPAWAAIVRNPLTWRAAARRTTPM